MLGVEAAGHGLDTSEHAASLAGGAPGILHGNKTYLLQDEDGQITEAHSISAGLDYPGIGPEHSWLHESGRVEYLPITDDAGARRVPAAAASSKGSSPRSKARTRSQLWRPRHGKCAEDQIILVNVSRPRRQGHLHRRRSAGGGDVSVRNRSPRHPGLVPGSSQRRRRAAARVALVHRCAATWTAGNKSAR